MHWIWVVLGILAVVSVALFLLPITVYLCTKLSVLARLHARRRFKIDQEKEQTND